MNAAHYSQPFRSMAPQYAEIGLAVIPLAENDAGKKPAVVWKPFQKTIPTAQEIEGWVEKYPAANIGIITGSASNLAVIDIDDNTILPQEVMQITGKTDLIVKTSRGHHLYYRDSGLKSINGFAPKLDLKAHGGYVVAPPSVNRQSGVQYNMLLGDLTSFDSLPILLADKIEQLQQHFGGIARQPHQAQMGAVQIGHRNTTLFDYLRKMATGTTVPEQLLQIAHDWNNRSPNPLPREEVETIVKSVWGYKEEGTLYTKGQQQMAPAYPAEMVEVLKNEAEAFWLLQKLRCSHNKNATFAMALEAMEREWGKSKYNLRKARDCLLRLGYITKVKTGGSKKGDCHTYCFGSRGKFLTPI